MNVTHFTCNTYVLLYNIVHMIILVRDKKNCYSCKSIIIINITTYITLRMLPFESKSRSHSIRLPVGNRNTLETTTASSSSSSAVVSSNQSDRVALVVPALQQSRSLPLYWYCSQFRYPKKTTEVRCFVERWISDGLPEFLILDRKLVLGRWWIWDLRIVVLGMPHTSIRAVFW